MGDEEGNVWIVDGGNAIYDNGSTENPDCYIITNPNNNKYVQGASKFKTGMVMGDFFGAQNVYYTLGHSYLPPSGTEYTKELGDYDDTPLLEEQHDYIDLNLDTFTDGFSLKLRTTMDGSIPHRFNGLLLGVSRKGSNRNNTQTNRG